MFLFLIILWLISIIVVVKSSVLVEVFNRISAFSWCIVINKSQNELQNVVVGDLSVGCHYQSNHMWNRGLFVEFLYTNELPRT